MDIKEYHRRSKLLALTNCDPPPLERSKRIPESYELEALRRHVGASGDKKNSENTMSGMKWDSWVGGIAIAQNIHTMDTSCAWQLVSPKPVNPKP